jgi:hypothetical protein
MSQTLGTESQAFEKENGFSKCRFGGFQISIFSSDSHHAWSGPFRISTTKYDQALLGFQEKWKIKMLGTSE